MCQSPERLARHGQTHPDLWPSASADRGDALSFKHRARERAWTGTKSDQVFLHEDFEKENKPDLVFW